MKEIEWYQKKIAQLLEGFDDELDRIAQMPLNTTAQIEAYEIARIVFNQRSRAVGKMRLRVEKLEAAANRQAEDRRDDGTNRHP